MDSSNPVQFTDTDTYLEAVRHGAQSDALAWCQSFETRAAFKRRADTRIQALTNEIAVAESRLQILSDSLRRLRAASVMAKDRADTANS